METVLTQRKSLAWGRREIGKMLRTLKERNQSPVNFTKAKILAAIDFAKIFLKRGEKAKVPEAIPVKGDNQVFIIRRDQVKEIENVGKKILAAYNDMAALAA
jgi:hypothetical protein